MFVFSNLATSLDGKIATTDRSFFPLGTPEDRKHMQVLRRRCDALLMGATTFRVYRKPCLIPGVAISAQPANILLSSALEGISPQWDFFLKKGLRRILLVGPEAPKARLKKFEATCEIYTLGKMTKRHPRALQILELLKNAGIKRLLIEGGGNVMWDFASLDLIDEYHVTLTPKIVGGNQAPTLVDGEGFNPRDILNLKLQQCRIVGDELYLTYRGRKGESSIPLGI